MIVTSQLCPNPYVGPRAFRYGETLYGRDREVMELLGLLIAERIVLLYSPSGAGKTSLVQAALIPDLKKEDFQVLQVIRVSLEPSPGLERLPTTNRYVLSVLLSLEEALPAEQQMPLAELARMTLADYLDQREAGPGAPKPSVLIFDQFEEILTVDPTDRAAKEAFFAQVGTALRARHRWALFAMREEYSAGLDPYVRPIPTRLHTTFRLELLGEDAARLAMQRPARQAGVEFTDAAARKLANDLRRVRLQVPEGTTEELGLYVEPVHLQVVCHRLWERLPADDREIGKEDIEAIGDVDSALAGYYVERVAAIAGETGVSERAIREWFDRQLISAQGIRGQVLQDHERSQGLENRAIAHLVDAHLVRAEQRRGATWLELAHDRLIEPVRKNNTAWYQANLSTLQLQADLWERQGRPGGLLLRDEALVEAEQWATAHQDELTDTERAFRDACRDTRILAEREQQQARRIRRWATFATLGAITACFALLGALYSLFQANDEAQKAHAARIASLAQALASDKQDDQRALLALQAYHVLSKPIWFRVLMKRSQVRMLDQVDDAFRTVLIPYPDFSHILHGHKSSVRAVAFSPDGKTLATGSDDKTVRLWEVDNLSAAPIVLSDHGGPVKAVAFSPDGKTLAVGSRKTADSDGPDETVRLWKVDNLSAAPMVLPDHGGSVRAVAFSPDSKTLAVSSRKTADSDGLDETVLWKLDNPSAVPMVLSDHGGPVRAVAFSPDGKTLAASDDKTVRLWELDHLSAAPMVFDSNVHQGPVTTIAFSPDSKTLASGSEDKTIVLWDLATGKPLVPPLMSHDHRVASVAFSPDGKTLISGSWDRTVRLWKLDSLSAAPIVLRGHSDFVLSVVFSSDSQTLASGSRDRTVRLWKPDSLSAAPIVLSEPKGLKDPVRAVAFSPDGQTLAAGTRSQDGAVQLWALGNPSSAGPIILPEHSGRALAVAFSPDGKTLAVGSRENRVDLWEVRNASAVPKAPLMHEKVVNSVVFSPDGETLAAGSGKEVWLWKLSNPMAVTRLPSPAGLVLSVAFSPDGQTLAAGTRSQDGAVQLWALGNPSAGPAFLRGHESAVRSVAFSRDGKTLASGSDDTTVWLWDLEHSGAVRAVLRGHESAVRSVAFSPDGKTLASGSDDTTVRLWDLENPGAVRAVLRDHEGAVRSVAFSPDAKEETLASGSEDTTIRIWIARLERLAAMVCEKVRRNLTLEEWRQFVGENIPYERTCPDLPIHPSFIEAGRDLAKAGDVSGAVAVFRKARTLDSRLDLDPRAEAKQFAAEGRVEKERGLAR